MTVPHVQSIKGFYSDTAQSRGILGIKWSRTAAWQAGDGSQASRYVEER